MPVVQDSVQLLSGQLARYVRIYLINWIKSLQITIENGRIYQDNDLFCVSNLFSTILKSSSERPTLPLLKNNHMIAPACADP